eukprot:Opistho-1_new@2633
MAVVISSISACIARQPLLTNTALYSSLFLAGDVVQQKIEGHSLDWARAARMGAMGLALGPVHHHWYSFIDRRLPSQSLSNVVKKVAADQAVFAPFCILSFFGGVATLEGRTPQETREEVGRKFWPTYKVDCAIWPLAQLLNFYFVPSQLRVAYVGTATLFWNVFLSHMKHSHAKLPIHTH